MLGTSETARLHSAPLRPFLLPHFGFSSAKPALGDEWKRSDVPGLCSKSRIKGQTGVTSGIIGPFTGLPVPNYRLLAGGLCD